MNAKKYAYSLLTAICLSPLLCIAAEDSATPDERILKKDFERMMAWFPGRYDNQEQVYFEDEMGVDESVRHGRIHHVFAPVELENFPGTTFYVEQYRNTDPTDVYRQRVYSFEPDFDQNAIRLTIYIPKNPKALLGAYQDPKKLENLKPADFTTYPGCAVYWKYQLNYYHGFMKEGACRVKSTRSGKTLVIIDDLQLSQEGIWIRDEAEDTNGAYVYGNKAGVHHKNNRARRFSCWVSPKKHDGEYGFYQNVEIHDQGGLFWLESPEHERVGFKMRNVVWPYGNNQPSLVLYAYRGEDEERAVSYSWTEPDAQRIGINLRWVQGSCSEVEEGFFGKAR